MMLIPHVLRHEILNITNLKCLACTEKKLGSNNHRSIKVKIAIYILLILPF